MRRFSRRTCHEIWRTAIRRVGGQGLRQASPDQVPRTVYESVGGKLFFIDLVERFYAGVETDSILRPLYPPNLGPGKRHLHLFLMQYFGGPATYSEERGHPRLRARHMPFTVGESERAAWIKRMQTRLEKATAEQRPKLEMLKYFENAARFMINR